MLEDIKLLTIKEVAKLLKKSTVSVSQMCVNDDIPAIRVGREWRINEHELLTWLNTNRNQ